MFSLVFKGGHPKVKLLWAAGGRTLTPLVSSETEEIGDDGQRELKSVCALETSTNLPSPSSKQQEKRKSRQTSMLTLTMVNDSTSRPHFLYLLTIMKAIPLFIITEYFFVSNLTIEQAESKSFQLYLKGITQKY